jgi:chaperonin cofactor prefoldin
MDYFTEEFRDILNGVEALQRRLNNHLDTINNRIGYLEQAQYKNDEFFNDLESILMKRKSQ